MGVGHLDIGLGQGDAQVFNPSPAIQQYGQILAQNKAKHDAEVKQLGDELAKGYDPNGLRNDADRQAYIDKYNDIKKFAIDTENEKDKTKKALSLAQVRQQLTDLGSFATGSKKQGIFERQLAMEHLKNPYLYDDDTAQKILAGKDKVWNDQGIINDPSQVVRGVNPDKVDADYDKHKASLIKDAQWQDFKGKSDTVAGKRGQWLYQQRGVPLHGDNGALESTLAFASSNKDFQKSLQDRYPQIQGNDPQSTLALRTVKYMQDRGDANGFVEHSKPEFKEAQAPVRPSYLEQWNMAHNGGNPNSPSKSQTNTPLYRQAWVSDILNGDENARKMVAAKISADPTYSGTLETGVGSKENTKGQLLFDVPAKIKYDAQGNVVETIPKHRVWIDPKDPNSKVKLNELLNETTGEKVDISALQTPGGKKHVGASPQQYQIKGKAYHADAVAKAAKASGMSVDEYVKAVNSQ